MKKIYTSNILQRNRKRNAITGRSRATTSGCKWKKRALLSAALLWTSLAGFSQSPGGISSNLLLWLKANTGTTPAIQGSNITGWADQSGNNNNATYIATVFSQTVVNPTYQQNVLNFNPSVRFPGTGNTAFSMLQGGFATPVTSNNVSAYAVYIINPATNTSGRIFDISLNASTSDWQNTFGADFICRAGNNVFGTRNNTNLSQVGPVINQPGVISSVHFTTANTALNEINGATFSSVAFPATPFNASSYRLGMSTYIANDWLNGDIAEVLFYNTDQSSAGTNHVQIESYLAIKYGISKAGNYISSANTVVWNAAANAGYQNDVFGIAMDTGSGLLQTQSNSMNTGSGNGVGQSAKGNIVISNPSSITTGGFLIVGHDANDFSLVTTNVPAPLTDSGYQRLNRSWKVQATGTVGSVSLNFETAGITSLSSLPVSGLKLIIDHSGTGNFTAGSPTVEIRSADAVTGSVVTFNNVTFSPAVFTFAAILPIPLPVTLTSLKAEETGCNEVTLKWSVTDAVAFRSFEVERNANNKGFSSTATIPYHPGQKDYRFTDSHLADGTYLYLLKLVNPDGSFSSSPIVQQSVSCTGTSGKITVIPNPGHDHISIKGFSNSAEIHILNLFGQVAIKASNISEADRIDIKDLPAAPYMIQVIQNGVVTGSAKMVKE